VSGTQLASLQSAFGVVEKERDAMARQVTSMNKKSVVSSVCFEGDLSQMPVGSPQRVAFMEGVEAGIAESLGLQMQDVKVRPFWS
jgi:hypothetical protein